MKQGSVLEDHLLIVTEKQSPYLEHAHTFGSMHCASRTYNVSSQIDPQSLRPLLPPFFLLESVGIGVTSSIRPIFIPDLASALNAD